jgi:hypothetical protein
MHRNRLKLYDPATEGSGSTQPPEQPPEQAGGEKPQAEGSKQEQPQDSEWFTLTNPDDPNDTVQVRPHELLQLAGVGYKTFKQEYMGNDNNNNGQHRSQPTQSASPTEEPEELTVEQQLQQVQKELSSMRQADQQRQHFSNIQQQLQQAAMSNPETKDDPSLAEQIAINALARHNMNTRTPINLCFQQALKSHLELEKSRFERFNKTQKNTGIIRNAMNQIEKGTSGVPEFDLNKSYGAKDMKNGVSLKALTEFLHQGAGE